MMVTIGNMRVMEVLAQATNVIAEGEVLQLLNVHNADISDEAYLQVIRYKTAKLFEAATRLGAIASNASAADESALAVYGMHLGTAFQLIDDVLDLSGDSQDIGKNLGDDLAEGKPTLPLLYAMRNSDAAQSSMIRRAIENGGLDQLPQVIEVVKNSGALVHVKKMAEIEASISCAAIAHFPESKYKQTLINLAEFAVKRDF